MNVILLIIIYYFTNSNGLLLLTFRSTTGVSDSLLSVTGGTGTGVWVWEGDVFTVTYAVLSVPIFPRVARNLCINPFCPPPDENFRGLRGGALGI